MRMITLRSSTIANVGYDPGEQEMVVQFNSGAHYRYRGVPADVYVAVITDPDSHGKAFDRLIKKGPYPYEKVDPESLNLHV